MAACYFRGLVQALKEFESIFASPNVRIYHAYVSGYVKRTPFLFVQYLPSSGVARVHPFGSFRGGSGSVTSTDRMSRSREEAMRPVWAASTVLDAKDWRAMY